MSDRIIIIGNSGSGNSTRARRVASEHGLVHLDLDSIIWEPGQIAVPRAPEAVQASLQDFVRENERWVIEGVYAEVLVPLLAPLPDGSAPDIELVFMNPGLESCLANNARRPWEPEKYETPELQESMYSNLIEWVTSYYTRTDNWSYAAHRRVFDEYRGRKEEVS
jgi:adenylate kinase family enzyme